MTAANSQYNLADFMFGARSRYALSNILIANLRQNMHFTYLQDDWRVNDQLTLNLGLRYEYATPWVEKDNILSNFDPATRTMIFARDGSLQERSTLKPDRNNFGPRLGAAYSINPLTVLRGGYGISYVHFHRAGGANVLPINGPQVINAVVNQTPTQADFRTTQQGYPAGLTDPSTFNPLASNITYMPEDYHSSRVQSWFASVQRELWRNALIDLAYIGNRADGLLLFANLNEAVPNNSAGTLSLQARRPIPEFGDITYSFNGGKSPLPRVPGQVRLADGTGVLDPQLADLVADQGQQRRIARRRFRQLPGAAELLQPRRRFLDGHVFAAVQQHHQLRLRSAVRHRPPLRGKRIARARSADRRLADRRRQQHLRG